MGGKKGEVHSGRATNREQHADHALGGVAVGSIVRVDPFMHHDPTSKPKMENDETTRAKDWHQE